MFQGLVELTTLVAIRIDRKLKGEFLYEGLDSCSPFNLHAIEGLPVIYMLFQAGGLKDVSACVCHAFIIQILDIMV